MESKHVPARQRLCEGLHTTSVLWSRKGGTFMAASQSFHIALAFLPLLLLAIAIAGALLQADSAARVQERVVALIAGEASPALADQVAVLLRQVKAGARLGGQLGLAALVASLIRIFYHMQKAFDLIWEAPVPESSEGLEVQASRFLRAEIRHFLVWIVIGLLLQLVFTFALVTSVVQAVPAILTVHLGALAVGPSVAITTLVFALVYKTQPRVPVAWRDTWLGAAMAAAAWEVGRQVLALGIGNSHYSAYGAVGSFLIVMVWLYFANSVLYLGAMFVRATAAEHAAEP